MKLGDFIMNKATTLSMARMTCRYFPLNRDDLASFYVNTDDARGINLLDKLTKHLDYVHGAFQQVICLGHKGVGKTTALYRLSKRLSGTYYTVSFSVQELFDVDRLTFVDLLCLIYMSLLSEFKDKLQDSEGLLQVYNEWYSVTEEVISNKRTAESNVESEARGGIPLKILELFTQITNILNFSTENRKTITNIVHKDINVYIDLLNKLITIISGVSGLPLLLIVEDLEKIPFERGKDIFVAHGSYFSRIKLRMILTAPIFLKYYMEGSDSIKSNFIASERYPLIEVVKANGDCNTVGKNTLKEIVWARVSKELIDEDALDLAVYMSGGVVRDLLAMVCEATIFCEDNRRSSISITDIKNAFRTLQEEYEDVLRKTDAEILLSVFHDPNGFIDALTDNFYTLVSGQAIIEYNGDHRHGVHPAVLACLVKSGMLYADEVNARTHIDL